MATNTSTGTAAPTGGTSTESSGAKAGTANPTGGSATLTPPGTRTTPAPASGGVKAPTAPATPAAPAVAPNSAADLLKSTLTAWGLQSLIPNISTYLQQGYSNDTLNLAIQNTSEWKQRFAGNEERKAKGLPVLSPADYLAAEESYQQVLQSYGLPSGFYDQHSDFNDFIGNDISAAELSARAKIAHDQYMNAPDAMKQTWQNYFGLDSGHAIAAILDPTKATQLIQDQSDQVGIGGTAALNGFSVSQQRAQQLQQRGVTLSQAQKAYQTIAESHATNQNIASRFGTTYDQTQEENNLLLGDGAAANKQQMLYDSEQALFKGTSGANQASLGTEQEH